MSAYTEWAKMFHDCKNKEPYAPAIGKIIELPELKIQLGNRILLTSDEVISIFDIKETVEHDNHTEYVNLNKTVILLPYSNRQRYIALGVVQE